MSPVDLLHVEPFEICSIRPPTENYSLTFRLTRNCYWNRCAFCPVYKLGARFSRRSLDDVLLDIERARRIDDLLGEWGMGRPRYSGSDFSRVASLVKEIRRARWEAGCAVDRGEEKEDLPPGLDPRLRWFLTWFKQRPTLEDSFSHVLTWRLGGGETCFLGDSDGLILKADFLSTVMEKVKVTFPSVSRFTVYGRTRSAARLRTLEDLKACARAGLNRVHFGLESGSDRVLSLVRKGVTLEDQVTGCLKVKEAGLSCSVYVMPGLGGSHLSEEHARETARMINAIGPDFVRLRTLEIFPSTPLEEMAKSGEFVECGEEEIVRELRILVSSIHVPVEFLSDSASNLLDLFGRLPDDRDPMLGIIDHYLGLSKREKLVFSLHSRLHSFMGQYGGLTEDLVHILSPYLRNNRLDLTGATDGDLLSIIRTIRSRLMP